MQLPGIAGFCGVFCTFGFLVCLFVLGFVCGLSFGITFSYARQLYFRLSEAFSLLGIAYCIYWLLLTVFLEDVANIHDCCFIYDCVIVFPARIFIWKGLERRGVPCDNSPL